MSATTELVNRLKASDQDYEWYPTTDRMIAVVANALCPEDESVMDIGAGDGRVLLALENYRTLNGHDDKRELYAIEKALPLVQQWPERITPAGCDFYEQNLACIRVDVIFCNPPYSRFEEWTATIIEAGYAKHAYLVIPRRWKESEPIQRALKKRAARARIIHSDDFHDAERAARAVVDIVEVDFPTSGWRAEAADPFDTWFDENISTFDPEQDGPIDDDAGTELKRASKLETIAEMVADYDAEYSIMAANYQAIFKLDYALLKELHVSKEGVRDGIKKRMAGLKTKYWQMLFDRLDAITSRLCTETKRKFLAKITGSTAIAFTTTNAYAVVVWAIKHANKYYDEQLIKLYRDISTFDGVMNYKSNQRAWEKSGWRYSAEEHSHYSLDYRIVVSRYNAIQTNTYSHRHIGNLAETAHELVEDILAVLNNLGFSPDGEAASRDRIWSSGEWQNWGTADGSTLFQAKAFKNGNVHLRFKPDAIKALNVEAGRLLGWLRSPEDVVTELGYSEAEASRFFRSSWKALPSSVALLAASNE